MANPSEKSNYTARLPSAYPGRCGHPECSGDRVLKSSAIPPRATHLADAHTAPSADLELRVTVQHERTCNTALLPVTDIRVCPGRYSTHFEGYRRVPCQVQMRH